MKYSMFDLAFVITAILFNLLIGGLWIASGQKNYKLVKKLGTVIVSLMIPLAIVFIDYLIIGRPAWIILCLVLIFIYLFLEVLLDFILKIEFRKNPVLHVPYIILFYIVEFAFIRISFHIDRLLGYLVSISFWIALAGLIYLVVARKKEKNTL